MEQPFGGRRRPTNLATLLFTEVKEGMVKPFLAKRSESIILTKDVPEIEAGIVGHAEEAEVRDANWQKLQPLEVAKRAGQVIATRILSEEPKQQKVGNSSDDTNLVEYLSDWDEMSFLSMKPMGETPDSGNYMHRRVRMVGMLKTVEDEWIKTKGEPQGEQGWEDFYQKVYRFFDTKLSNEKSNSEANWLKVYSMYYLLAWNHRDIGVFDDPNPQDTGEVKYRALLKTIFSQGKEAREKIMQKMSVLDKSTKMVVGKNEDSSPSFLFRRGLMVIDDLDFRSKHLK